MKSNMIRLFISILFSIAAASCALQIATITPVSTATFVTPSLTLLPPTDTPTPTQTATSTPTAAPTETITPVPTVASLKATVTADLLSCRYGPGPEYLFLYGLRKGANIKLIGRTDGDNWNWVYVDGKNKCWVNAKFIEMAGEKMQLPIVYPGIAKLPVSPYYPPTDWVGTTRNRNTVEVSWNDVPLRAGDEEDENMLHYIIEVWRCENGQMIFEPLATNALAVTFVDEPGCTQSSHGRVFVQEKHGFAGPVEIPWPSYTNITPTP